MKTFALLSGLMALSVVSATPTPTDPEPPTKRSSLPAVSVSGNAFYADGKRFYVRGIDYQPGGSSANLDPLVDADICKRDIADFKALGINSVRVYAVDNSKNHDECMQALSDAGIYLVMDVNNPKYSINRADPATSYNAAYIQSVLATVAMFAKYDNTMAFFSGNEVINDEAGTDKAAPFVKAITRDMKNFMNAQGLRNVPVGYSAADVSANRMETAEYFNCGSDDARSDFFAFNDYSWCNSDFVTSGWDQKVKNFTDYGIAIFLSEYGCTEDGSRTFGELEALMSSKMTGVYSGGLVYEYSKEEGNEYGIVTLNGNSVKKSDEWSSLQKALKNNPAPAGNGGAASTTHSVDCPTSAANWKVDPSMLPVMPSQAQKYMKDGAGDGPGLKGKGSQQDADSGTATASTTGGSASPTSASADADNDDSDDDPDSAATSVRGNLGGAAFIVTGLTLCFTLGGTLLL